MADKKISQLTSATTLTGAELVPVVQAGATVQTTVTDFGGAVGYTPAGTGAVATTVQTKLRESVSVKDFGAVGDGVTDDTAAIQAAFDSGFKVVLFPAGTYKTTGVEVKSTSSVAQIIGQGEPTISLVTGTSRVALLVSKNYLAVNGIVIVSTGTMSDGNNTVGIKQIAGVAYTNYTNIRMSGFSLRAVELIQCVYAQFNNLVIYNSTYGLSLEQSGGNPCTTVTVNSAYISGCTRGFNGENASTCTLNEMVFEYCGSNVTTNGAFHVSGGTYLLNFPYWEANYRNVVSADARFELINQTVVSIDAANSITYSGLATNLRGVTSVLSYGINTPRIGPDTISNLDLVIGSNLTVPLAGTSVQWGNSTTETLSGSVVASTWTTIKTFGTEMNGTNAQKAAYQYVVYGGIADLSTGFDFGTIFNDTARSFSGTLPAWLRMSGQALQINLASSSYGLQWKLVLVRVYPG